MSTKRWSWDWLDCWWAPFVILAAVAVMFSGLLALLQLAVHGEVSW